MVSAILVRPQVATPPVTFQHGMGHTTPLLPTCWATENSVAETLWKEALGLRGGEGEKEEVSRNYLDS